ncbi:DsbA family oxidoreductase [Pantoea ananatis]|uniref:DsbA family oxidoreductase n=1 Tax=Pantoea ananas TaxID=553 RepID=UPI000D6C47CF|nr:DsbA family protein [Pantoea ananatis]PWK05845.1 putative DsbA family dithiol-disulfide isomerase [Pantoea ananatis]
MLKIDLYTDIICPWCIVGQYRLDKVLKERFPGLQADIHHHPVLLMPGIPAEGVLIADLLPERYGVHNPEAAFSRVERVARLSGLELNLKGQPRAYPTQAAHALIMAARSRGKQHPLAVAITEAYFLKAMNIASTEVLADIATSYGFERSEALAVAEEPAWHARVGQALADASSAGVQSVPHFVFNAHIELSGGRSEDEITGAVEDALLRAE